MNNFVGLLNFMVKSHRSDRILRMQGEMKVIGKRKPSSGGVLKANDFLKLIVELRGRKPFIPKGIHRFKTHEEKDAWTLKMLTR